MHNLFTLKGAQGTWTERKCYRAQPFASDEERITFLFALYEKYTAPLTAEARAKAGKKRRKKI